MRDQLNTGTLINGLSSLCGGLSLDDSSPSFFSDFNLNLKSSEEEGGKALHIKVKETPNQKDVLSRYSSGFHMTYDIIEQEDRFLYIFDVPGFTKDEVGGK